MSTILIVDDLRVNLELLEARLEGEGFETISASNGVEALEILRSHKVDLIISDILMPKMDGYALCRECKTDERLRRIPFIFYTATYTDKKDEAFALSLGAEKFVIKPAKKAEFLAVVEHFLDQYKTGSIRPSEAVLAEDDGVYLKDYNERLVAKLEKKILDLEAAREVAAAEYRRAQSEVRSNVARLESLLNISHYRADSLDDLLDYALKEAVHLTHSDSGCIIFHDDEKRTPICAAVFDKTNPKLKEHFFEAGASIWEETVLLQTPLVVNERPPSDASSPPRLWVPSAKVRFLIAPVVNKGTPTAIVCVTDKPTDYDETDMRQLQLLMDEVWRIKSQQETERERMRLASAVEQAHEGIAILKVDGEIQYANSAMRTMLHNLNGLSGNLFEDRFFSEDTMKGIRPAVSDKAVWSGRLTHVTDDGTPATCESTFTPIQDNSGNLVNIVLISRDITEELKMEERLRQSQKMEAIGTLAGGIAHDFNNILSGIIGYAELAAFDIPENEEAHGFLMRLLTACDRAKDLVAQILAFSRQTEQQKKPTHVLPIISEICRFLRASLPASIQIVQKFQTDEDLIMADAVRFHQVVMNLCTNSGHAMREKGGVLEITTSKEILSDDDITQYPNLSKGPHLRVAVRDFGCGIPHHILERIFEPYFTTKEKGEGTGLGLAVVHGIVTDHGGCIKVYSEEDKGTVVHLMFPLVVASAEEETSSRISAPPVGSETILLVDDEENIRQFVKKSLERIGYTVVAAKSGSDALSQFRAKPDKFDLVLTDKTMRHMSGFTLAETILAENPNLPILLCTGFLEKRDHLRAEAVGIREVLMKPMRSAQLALAIRRTLDSRPPESPKKDRL